MTRTPYEEIDEPVRALCRVLNRFPGVTTYTSCGGHPEPGWDCQAPQGEWYVDWHVDRSDEGWASLEFMGWISYDIAPGPVVLETFAKPPYLNQPGQMLFFRWAGLDPEDPTSTADAFAKLLAEHRRRYYVTAHRARNWVEL